MKNHRDIRSLSEEDLDHFFLNQRQPSYRKKQVMEWIWCRGVSSFKKISNIGVDLRNKLDENFKIYRARKKALKESKDGTVKLAIQLFDKSVIEAALIPTSNRMTACISSQVGCSLSCDFCATASLKRVRNLEAYELFEQMILLNQESQIRYQRDISHVVLMGMGEPLLNYNNVLRAMKAITEAKIWNITPKKITLSTVGFSPLIKKLADDHFGFNLAISLHTVSQKLREKIMPHSKKQTLLDLKNALIYWYQKTKKKVSFEYLIWENINDTKLDIDQLVNYCKSIPCKVNLISYNTVSGSNYQRAKPHIFQDYIQALKKYNIIATIRHSRGEDIEAGCGQLANQLEKVSLKNYE